MLTAMTRHELDTLDDLTLLGACLSPVITRIRGRDLRVKSDVFGELTPPRRALLAFYVLHAHATDPASFWGYVRLFVAEWNTWPLLEESARYFGDDRLLEVYRTVAATVHAASDPDVETATALHRAYHVAAAATVRVAADHVRAHPQWYVRVS